MEHTFVMVKPDGVQRGLVGPILKRFEDKGFQLIGLKMKTPNEELLREHYMELVDKPFFNDLLEYVGSGPVVCMVWRGREAVKEARKMIGATNPTNANNGTIRGDYGQVAGRNVIHGSDAIESAAREIQLWFPEDDDINHWESALQQWTYD
jgi:nucleoside-diphosphate kinase